MLVAAMFPTTVGGGSKSPSSGTFTTLVISDYGQEAPGFWQVGNSNFYSGSNGADNVTAAVSIRNVTVPVGKTVSSAILRMEVFDVDPIPSHEHRIYAQKVAAPAAISITNLPSTWASTTAFTAVATGGSDVGVRSYNVLALVQEIIAAGWIDGGRMNFKLPWVGAPGATEYILWQAPSGNATAAYLDLTYV